jgi:hypothetical protein
VLNVNANQKNARGASPAFAVEGRSACPELAIIVSLIRFFKLAGIIGEWSEDCQPRGLSREGGGILHPQRSSNLPALIYWIFTSNGSIGSF